MRGACMVTVDCCQARGRGGRAQPDGLPDQSGNFVDRSEANDAVLRGRLPVDSLNTMPRSSVPLRGHACDYLDRDGKLHGRSGRTGILAVCRPARDRPPRRCRCSSTIMSKLKRDMVIKKFTKQAKSRRQVGHVAGSQRADVGADDALPAGRPGGLCRAIMPLRIVFMGTPDFAVPTLTSRSSARATTMVAVYTQPPRARGRGMATSTLAKSPVPPPIRHPRHSRACTPHQPEGRRTS